MGAYDKGDQVRVSATFKNIAGTATDPTTVVAKIKDPSGNVSTYTYGTDAELIKDATGMYHIDVDIDERGLWYYRWEATGAVKTAEESTFTVRQSQF
jgi:hypothetical protein